MSRMVGTVSRGLRAPIIKQGDDIVDIVVNTVLERKSAKVRIFLTIFPSPGQKNAGTAFCDPGVGMYLNIQLFTAAAAVLGKKSASYRPSAALRTAHMVTTEQNTCHDEAYCHICQCKFSP